MTLSPSKEQEISYLTKENEQLIKEINRLTTKVHRPKSETGYNNQKSSMFTNLIKDSPLYSFKVDDSIWRRQGTQSTPELPKAKVSFESRTSPLNQTKAGRFEFASSGDQISKKLNGIHSNQKSIDDVYFKKSTVHFDESNSKDHLHKQFTESSTDKEKRRLTERLIGEIAFQLDKRILHNIFSHRKRLYGFSVRNISEKIDEYTRNNRTGAVEIEKREGLRAKRDATMTFLSQAAGYNPRQHPAVAEALINKYGVLRVVKGKSEEEYKDMLNEEYLKSVIVSTVDGDSTYDALTLLNSLIAFAKLDGKPLFLW